MACGGKRIGRLSPRASWMSRASRTEPPRWRANSHAHAARFSTKSSARSCKTCGKKTAEQVRTRTHVCTGLAAYGVCGCIGVDSCEKGHPPESHRAPAAASGRLSGRGPAVVPRGGNRCGPPFLLSSPSFVCEPARGMCVTCVLLYFRATHTPPCFSRAAFLLANLKKNACAMPSLCVFAVWVVGRRRCVLPEDANEYYAARTDLDGAAAVRPLAGLQRLPHAERRAAA